MLKHIIISYPRSGSNFLQHVLSRNAKIKVSSIYGRPNKRTYSLKSHALSYDWLVDELARFKLQDVQDYKLVWLTRDPRDILVSFYNFVCSRKDLELPVSMFLDSVSYEYAFEYGTAESYNRRVSVRPYSIWESFVEFSSSWEKFSENNKILKLTYEEILDPESRAWPFLFNELVQKELYPKKDSVQTKVAQYGKSHLKRGVINSWNYSGSEFFEFCEIIKERCIKELPELAKKYF